MRPLEIALALALVLTFATVAVRPLRRRPWLKHAALLAAVVAAGQATIEGPRWQLVPAYVVAGSCLLASLWQTRARREDHPPLLRDRIAAAGAIGIGSLALAVAVALPAMIPVFHFPPPEGSYGVGTLIYHWVDGSRPEIFTPDPGDKRELMVQVWYPTRKRPSTSGASYTNGADFRKALRLMHMPPFLFDHLRYVTTNAQPSAPVAEAPAVFPVLIFSPGRAGYRSNSTFLVESLVSHGYIVAGIDHPYTAGDVAFPDGRHVSLDHRIADDNSNGEEDSFLDGAFQQLGEDAVFVLNQLTAIRNGNPHGILNGRFDLQHVGILGSSLGGIAAAEACRLDRRFHACLALDVAMPHSVVRAGLQQPTMWITGTSEYKRQEGWAPAAIAEHMTTMQAVFSSLPGDGFIVSITGMFHAEVSDFSYVIPPPLGRAMKIVGPLESHRSQDIINAYARAFFDTYLKGSRATLLDGPSPQYPEVRVERR